MLRGNCGIQKRLYNVHVATPLGKAAGAAGVAGAAEQEEQLELQVKLQLHLTKVPRR